MADWFRNKTWSEDIEATFEAKLARARDRSQYLKIQGYELLVAHPGVAAQLFERCAKIDDHWRADALLYLGQARLRLGDPIGAVEALDEAIEQERRVTWAATGARSDLALIVSFYAMSERYTDVLPYLTESNADLRAASAEDLAAEAMIRGDRGEVATARPLAIEALRWLDGLMSEASDRSDHALGPGAGISAAALVRRLEAIALPASGD